jgi:hypothetical protein
MITDAQSISMDSALSFGLLRGRLSLCRRWLSGRRFLRLRRLRVHWRRAGRVLSFIRISADEHNRICSDGRIGCMRAKIADENVRRIVEFASPLSLGLCATRAGQYLNRILAPYLHRAKDFVSEVHNASGKDGKSFLE